MINNFDLFFLWFEKWMIVKKCICNVFVWNVFLFYLGNKFSANIKKITFYQNNIILEATRNRSHSFYRHSLPSLFYSFLAILIFSTTPLLFSTTLCGSMLGERRSVVLSFSFRQQEHSLPVQQKVCRPNCADKAITC